MELTIIVAAAENDVIGRDGALPWHLPGDLRHFKRVTMGKPIIMGRKTHESIGRALPGRTNIVISRQSDYSADACHVVHTLDEALGQAADEGATEAMVIGGAALYAESLPRTDRILLTRVHASLDGDVRFPQLDPASWQVVAVERHDADEAHAYPYSFMELVRVC